MRNGGEAFGDDSTVDLYRKLTWNLHWIFARIICSRRLRHNVYLASDPGQSTMQIFGGFGSVFDAIQHQVASSRRRVGFRAISAQPRAGYACRVSDLQPTS